MFRRVAPSVLVLFALAVPHARAQTGGPETSAAPRVPPPPPEALLSHKGQFGLSVLTGVGYRVVVPYEQNVVCGEGDRESQNVCADRAPVFLELGASFGITHRLDFVTDFRFGLEGQPVTGRHQFAVMPGVRFWLDPDRQLKFFTSVQGVFDSTGQNQPNVSTTDFGLRNANGLMYDFIRNFGVYLQFGPTIGFKRWFRIEVDAGIGVQVRYP